MEFLSLFMEGLYLFLEQLFLRICSADLFFPNAIAQSSSSSTDTCTSFMYFKAAASKSQH